MTRSLLAEDPDALVAPYLMSGGTDAKHFRKLGMRSYGFAPLRLPGRPRLHRALPRRRRAGAGRRAGVRRAGASTGSSTRSEAGSDLRGQVQRRPGRMILRRSTTRRVPSGPMRTRSSSQPPCSARSTSSRVTTLREKLAGEGQPLSNSHSTPRAEAAGGQPSSGLIRRSVRRHVVEGRRRSPRAGSAPRRPARRAAGRRCGRRRSGAVTPGPVPDPGQRDLAAAIQPRPVGGPGDRLDDPARRARRGRRPTKLAKCGGAPRGSPTGCRCGTCR